MRGQFIPHHFRAKSLGRSLLFIALGITTLLQNVVVVNCAPSSSLGYNNIARANNGPSPSAAPGGTSNATTGSSSTSSVAPAAIYNGSYDSAHQQGVHLRIGNGGAGQSGLIRALADAFIRYRVSQGDEPFEVAWYLGDTTQSLAMLAEGTVDVAVTYNAAAEKQSMDSGAASRSVYAFRDHFILAGPKSNPANLTESDDIYTIFNKIVNSGKNDVSTPPSGRPSTRFLSRFDKSATNIKESQLFTEIGQVPWAYDYSKWYHQYPRFPIESLETASLLSEYTLTDLGTWLSSTDTVKARLSIFKRGSDNATDPLLNPAHALYGARADAAHAVIGRSFMEWLGAEDGGQNVIRTFSRNGVVLYSEAP